MVSIVSVVSVVASVVVSSQSSPMAFSRRFRSLGARIFVIGLVVCDVGGGAHRVGPPADHHDEDGHHRRPEVVEVEPRNLLRQEERM